MQAFIFVYGLSAWFLDMELKEKNILINICYATQLFKIMNPWVVWLTFIFLRFVMQLRNLVWATSKHDVYLMSHSSVNHWSSLTSAKSEVLNVSGHVAPSEVSVSGQIYLGLTVYV